MNKEVKIGYACLNLDIEPNNYKTLRKDNITDEKLKEIIVHNLQVLEATIDYNIKRGNQLFRISSSLIPFGSSPLNQLNWENQFNKEFTRIKEKILTNNIRVSVHPGQYTVLNSPNQKVMDDSIRDLEYHATLLDLLSNDPTSKMVLHIGGIYGDKPAALKRFIKNYEKLSLGVKKYLVIENDDRLFTVEDALFISEEISIPVIFDNLHHEVNPSLQDIPIQNIINQVVQTWQPYDGNPKFHYSQQANNKRVGAHSPTIFIDQFITDYQTIYSLHPIDIMLEVKDKNRSFVKVDQLFHPQQKVLEQEWSKYKYWVMSRSQVKYNELRTLFKNNHKVDPLIFYQIIDSLVEVDQNTGYEINAFHHVWGYFKKLATTKEKESFLSLLEQLEEEKVTVTPIYNLLKRLAKKYEVDYLLNSYYFD